MRVWIDATHHDDDLEVFGMTLLERQLRSLLDAQKQVAGLRELAKELQGLSEARAYIESFMRRQLEPTEVRIELRDGAGIPASIPQALLARLPITWSVGDARPRDRLAAALRDADQEPLLALSADTVVDVRVLEHLAWADRPLAFLGGTGEEAGAALRLDGPIPETTGESDADTEAETLYDIAMDCLRSGRVKELSQDDFEGYVRKLRRTLRPYLFRVTTESAVSKVEHFLFWSNYKGATDLMTKYVYPPLVWRMVVPLAKRRVQPNVVTAIGIVCCFAAIPCFAAGMWIPGLLLAYAMSVLDSVDGKLARVTFTSSKQGDVLDHGTDVVHPPLWYCAWAWGLSGGDPFSMVFQASLWLAGMYMTDRILETLFKSCTGDRSIQDYTPLDARLRTFVSRRNVNLALFTVALPLGLGVEALYAVVGLQLATVLYHLMRVVQFWSVGAATVPAVPSRDDALRSEGALQS